jgi:hypothetical protein
MEMYICQVTWLRALGGPWPYGCETLMVCCLGLRGIGSSVPTMVDGEPGDIHNSTGQVGITCRMSLEQCTRVG